MFRTLSGLTKLCQKCLKTGLLSTRNFQTSKSLAALNDFQIKKITSEFDHLYDKNNDGYIDVEDMSGLKRVRLRLYCHLKEGATRVEAYHAAYDDFLTLLLDQADSDSDGKVSRESWISLWEKVISETVDRKFSSLPQWVRIMPAGLFPVLDVNADGQITPDEYRDFWHYVAGFPRIGDEALKHVFEVMTEGGKYKLDLPRIEDLYADFYLSDDPSTPGKYISGPILY